MTTTRGGLRTLEIDAVCGVPVYVCLAGEIRNIALHSDPAHYLIAFFQVVTESGVLFTSKDLEGMCLNEGDVTELENLCERRLGKIITTFFPLHSESHAFRRVHCTLDTKGCVHVVFSISARKPSRTDAPRECFA